MKTAAYITALLAIYAITQRQDAADVEYTRNLEEVVATCLSGPTGKPVTVGDEVFLCGIVNTGERVASK